ncbi:hypothetical protein GHV40_01385 [Devosia sp. D6-9]|nr:hypothetical protein GHV40_01385 [Devosia sp. D6-9]
MRILTLVTLATVVVSGAGLATTAVQAGTQSTVLSSKTFENRCAQRGGMLTLVEDGTICKTLDVAVVCEFDSIRADCTWEGNRLQSVYRLIGMPDAVAIGDSGGDVPGKKGGGGGFQNPNLPLNNK